jgi:uncharacterized protein YabN with tetrapyrrole methylase and pyrophosphatase domain
MYALISLGFAFSSLPVNVKNDVIIGETRDTLSPARPFGSRKAPSPNPILRHTLLDGIPAALPALLYAYKVQSRASSIGFDWDSAAGAWQKVTEEMGELEAELETDPGGSPAVSDELGDVLFSIVNVARHLRVDPEASLRSSAGKFKTRFAAMEALATERGVKVTDALWNEVKAAEGSSK